MSATAILPAFRNPVRESQAVFRTVMDAMSRPGCILPLDDSFASPAPLNAAAAAILLTLADFETAVWLDEALSQQPDVADFLRFHTGALVAEAPGEANFAVVADAANAPGLAMFAQGTPDYPDRSTTVIFQVSSLEPDGWTFAGPGINGRISFGAEPLPDDFAAQLRQNRNRFPRGVDVIFAGSRAIAAMPRSVRLMEAG